MRPVISILLLLGLCVSSLSAQYEYLQELSVTELIQMLEKPEHDTLKVELFNELAFRYRNKEEKEERDQAKVYAENTLNLAKQIGYAKGISDGNMRLGYLDDRNGDYQEALKHYQETLAYRKKNDSDERKASIYNNIGIVYRKMDDFSKAIENYKDGLSHLSPDTKAGIKGKLYNNLALAYKHLEYLEEAVLYFDSSLQFKRAKKDSLGIATTSLNLADLYGEMGAFERARESLNKSCAYLENGKDGTGSGLCLMSRGNIYFFEKKYEDAKTAYEKALNYLNLSADDILKTKKNLANAYRHLGDYDKALELYQSCLDSLQENENSQGFFKATVHYNMGLVYQDIKKPQRAISQFEQALFLLGDKNERLQSKILAGLSDNYAIQGEYDKAYRFVRRSEKLWQNSTEDYMNSMHLQSNLTQDYLENRLDLSEIELKITKYMQEKQLFYLLGGIFLLMFLSAAAGLAYYFQRQKRIHAELEIDGILQEHEIKTHYARLEGQDNERRRIAQDLHDRLGSMLSTIKLYFSTLDTKIDVVRLENREQYQKVSNLLDEATEEVRNISHDMQSGVLKNFGLAAQIEDLAETIEKSKQLEVEVTTHKMDNRLDNMLEVKIYRIIQELVGNALKHAKASKLSLHLNKFDDVVNLIVEDDGVGFDLESIKGKKGMGLNNVRSRIKALNGKLTIDSLLSRGTTISVDIPLKVEDTMTINS